MKYSTWYINNTPKNDYQGMKQKCTLDALGAALLPYMCLNLAQTAGGLDFRVPRRFGYVPVHIYLVMPSVLSAQRECSPKPFQDCSPVLGTKYSQFE